MSEWISVKEKVPDEFGDYLCSVIIPSDRGKYVISIKVLRWYVDHTNRSRGHFSCEGMIVTHWMPIPQAPKVELKWD